MAESKHRYAIWVTPATGGNNEYVLCECDSNPEAIVDGLRLKKVPGTKKLYAFRSIRIQDRVSSSTPS